MEDIIDTRLLVVMAMVVVHIDVYHVVDVDAHVHRDVVHAEGVVGVDLPSGGGMVVDDKREGRGGCVDVR
jgi:hypothetical protein